MIEVEVEFVVKFFKEEEFLCPCCGGGSGKMSAVLVLWLDLLRSAWGRSVVVNSGWRCWKRNMMVGGSKLSRHRIGCAVDVRPVKADPDVMRMFVILARRLCSRPGWEYLPYKNFVHIGVPRTQVERVWNGQTIVL